LAGCRDRVEYNIEGDPRPDWLAIVQEVCPDQCTLVPVVPGEVTSQAGWTPGLAANNLSSVVGDLKALGIRVSVFVDPLAASIELAAQVGADRVELYTEPFARAFAQSATNCANEFEAYVQASQFAHSLGLGVNAGHDLDLENLSLFKKLPHLAEVSIGHALVSRAVFKGLDTVVREYLEVLS
jgi:pyridoxine 5-phosphate synthase